MGITTIRAPAMFRTKSPLSPVSWSSLRLRGTLSLVHRNLVSLPSKCWKLNSGIAAGKGSAATALINVS